MENNLVKKNFEFYLKKCEELYKKYPRKYLIIKDEKVDKVFETIEEAFEYAKNNLKLGEYIIQRCDNKKEDTQMFNSRVEFNASK